ncbi:MAG: hypothetical protein OXC62_01055 [Aestuariivita sp.]|nr:hypothetical protein [Aestuariivita sp.]
MEQDRTPNVLPCHTELAGTSTDQSRGHHRPHRGNHDTDWLENSITD